MLDFVNTDEQIKNSFQPFYTTTFLEGRTDYNKLYGFRKSIKDFGLYNYQDVDNYYKFMSAHGGSKQDEVALGKLSSLLKPINERYNDLASDEDRFSVRMVIRNFVKSYAYITQITRIHDEELFKEYVFASNLLPLLPVGKVVIQDFLEKVQLEYTSLKESFSGSIVLDKKDASLGISGDKAKVKLPKKDTLQNIIDKVNERFEGNFNDADRVIVESIFQMFMGDKDIKKYKRYAKDSTLEMFEKSLFPDKFQEMATQCCIDNSDSYRKLFTDTEFYQQVMKTMARELYKILRKE